MQLCGIEVQFWRGDFSEAGNLNCRYDSKRPSRIVSFQEGGSSGSGECGGEESMEVKAVTVPSRPTQEEVDKHCLNHVVYRNWCEFCVKRRGKEVPHKSGKETEVQIPVLCMTLGS